MFRSVKSLAGAALISVVCVGLFTLASVRSYATYRNSMQVQILTARLDAFDESRRQERQTIREELNALEKTIYSPPPPPDQFDRKPSAIEKWQINRFTDLEKRMTALERRLYRLEP